MFDPSQYRVSTRSFGPRLEQIAHDAKVARVVNTALNGDVPKTTTIESLTDPSLYTDAVKQLGKEVPRHENRKADIIGAWNRNIAAELRPIAFLLTFRLSLQSRTTGLIPGPVTLESIQQLPPSQVRDALLAALGYFDWHSASRGVRAAALLGMIGRASVERAL